MPVASRELAVSSRAEGNVLVFSLLMMGAIDVVFWNGGAKTGIKHLKVMGILNSFHLLWHFNKGRVGGVRGILNESGTEPENRLLP